MKNPAVGGVDIPNQWVQIRPINPAGPAMMAMLGETPPTFTSAGGWSFKPRPRRSGFTAYDGVDPYTMVVELMFDGFAADLSVEGWIEMLRLMMRTRVGPRKEPPVVRMEGAGIPLSWLDWVIQDLVRSEELRNDAGLVVRSTVTLTLLQYLSADIVVSPAAAAQERAASNVAAKAAAASIYAPLPGTTPPPAPAPTARTYTVKAGDTLSAIAAAQLGSFARWTDIANLNGIRDPRSLQVGAVLRLPT